MTIVTSIEDLHKLYVSRVPRMFVDYVDSGSWSESTYRSNSQDFDLVRLRQRVAVDMSDRSIATTMAGQKVEMPVGLAPVGLTGMQIADGEIKAARAAAKFGVPYVLSTMSVCSVEDVAAHAGRGFWFQLYVMRDEEFVASMLSRAQAAGCEALVLTLDLQILGQRHKDLKNGLSVPPKPRLRNWINLATKPRWCLGMLGTSRRQFGNIVGHAKGVTDVGSLMEWTARQFDPKLDWQKVEKIRDMWNGRLILKGIMDAEDARKATDCGADAIIVSNHGGRQLDGAQSAVRALPAIVEAVGERTEVHVDSGIRCGQDILKSIALGAKAAYIGRAYIYGLGAFGESGVTCALDLIKKELDTTMALCGERHIEQVGRQNIFLHRDFDAWH